MVLCHKSQPRLFANVETIAAQSEQFTLGPNRDPSFNWFRSSVQLK